MGQNFKKTWFVFVSISLFLSLFSGCSSSNTEKENNIRKFEITQEYDDSVTTEDVYHDLTKDVSIQITGDIEQGEIYILPYSLKTNQGKISIKNKSGNFLTVYLYSDTSRTKWEQPVKQLSFDVNEKNDFTGLIHSDCYRIGVSTEVSTQLDLQVTD